jgi:hypothetical protein
MTPVSAAVPATDIRVSTKYSKYGKAWSVFDSEFLCWWGAGGKNSGVQR